MEAGVASGIEDGSPTAEERDLAARCAWHMRTHESELAEAAAWVDREHSIKALKDRERKQKKEDVRFAKAQGHSQKQAEEIAGVRPPAGFKFMRKAPKSEDFRRGMSVVHTLCEEGVRNALKVRGLGFAQPDPDEIELRDRWARRLVYAYWLLTCTGAEWSGGPYRRPGTLLEDRASVFEALDREQRERLASLVLLALDVLGVPASPRARGPGEPQEIEHAADFAWVSTADGSRYDFETGRQRDIMRVLFEHWRAGGDGAFMTEAAILEALDAKIERLRVAARFADHPALGTIICRCGGAAAAWALHLREPRKDHG